MASLLRRVKNLLKSPPAIAPVTVPVVDDALPPVRPIFSFIVDSAPRFLYEGFHLAHSLIQHAAQGPADIHVQVTTQVSQAAREVFSKIGCHVHEIQRFGDGKFSNKLSQLPNLLPFDCDRVVLLDTDMIVVDDLRPLIRPDALLAKMIDTSNPSTKALEHIARSAGAEKLPPLVGNDVGNGSTYFGNCNGGFYSIPRRLMQPVSESWRKWATWLLANIEPLAKEKKTNHVDQVSMWLAILLDQIPFEPCSSNLNFHLHLRGDHRYYDPNSPICILHYHDFCLSRRGLIDPDIELTGSAAEAVAKANRQISQRQHESMLKGLVDEVFSDSFKRPKPTARAKVGR